MNLSAPRLAVLVASLIAVTEVARAERCAPALGVSVEGTSVVSLTSGSIAERLGLAKGDRIVRINGTETPDAKTIDVVSNMLVAFKQEIVALEVERGQEKLELRRGEPPRAPRWSGLAVDQTGFLSDAGRHVRLRSVEPGSAWDQAGITTRDVIVAIDGRKVNGTDSFHKALALAKDPAVLEVADAVDYTPAARAKRPRRHVAILFTPELPAPSPTRGLGKALGGVLGGR